MIGTIENAIIERLHTVYETGALGYKPVRITSFGGNKDDAPKEWMKDFPALALMHDRSVKKNSAGTVVMYDARFVLIGAARSFRNEKQARHGGGNNVGASQMIEDSASILNRFGLGIKNVKPVEIGDIEPFYSDDPSKDRASVYGLYLTVPYSVESGKFDIDSGTPLETIHTNWDLPPLGGIGATLPDDANADATSHVTGD